MNFNFELLLTFATCLAGILWLIDARLFAKQRQQVNARMLLWSEYARSFFPILLVVLILRSFIVEPFHIPSGSDEPTLLVGDFLVANKFAYGLRLPVIHTKIFPVGEPKTGDIVLFRYPLNPSSNYIKRIIGIPGDKIEYINKELYINGKIASLQSLGSGVSEEGKDKPILATQKWREDLGGIQHEIFTREETPAQDLSLIVPSGQYFTMGDNRDLSNDSRYWGFVPEENFVGKAWVIWFSWDSIRNQIRWGRIGKLI